VGAREHWPSDLAGDSSRKGLKDSQRIKYRGLKRADQSERNFIDKNFRTLVEPLESLVKKIEEKPQVELMFKLELK
jgi:hypothetical protein